MNASERTVKVAVIGVGHLGHHHARIYTELPGVELAAVVDVAETRRREEGGRLRVPALSDYRELLGKVDAVSVAVPTVLHHQITREFLLAGSDVLVEKPITRTLCEADDLVGIAVATGRILQVGHSERYNGGVQALAQHIHDPDFIEVHRMGPFPGRGTDVDVVLDLMIHDIDIVLGLMKSEVKHVDAVGQVVKSPYEDIATAILQFENGTIANVSASRLSETKIRAMAISQEKAFIYLNFETQDINIYRGYSPSFFVSSKEITYKQESFVERVLVQKENALKEEIQHFAHCILGKSEPIVSGEDDIKTLAIALKIIEKINEKHKEPDGRLNIKAPSGTVG